MSVQIIKWIILLFVTGNCLSETCKANDAPKVCLPVQSNITIINQADNMLDYTPHTPGALVCVPSSAFGEKMR